MSFDVHGGGAEFGTVLDANPMIAPGDRRVSATPADGMRLAAPSENRLLIDAISAHVWRSAPDGVGLEDRAPAEDALRLSAEGLCQSIPDTCWRRCGKTRSSLCTADSGMVTNSESSWSHSPQNSRRLRASGSSSTNTRSQRELDPAWAALPLEVTRRDGRTMLVLKDPGGEPLDRVLERSEGQPLELTRALRIAIGLATALGQVHRHGLIHKDIKPANVLVDDAGNVWLTGFGIASRLPRESQAPAPPEVIAGTLPYMAPEQTGRMNRSIDARSDLYSLGVTLYQMLTGTLPFAAADPLEWVHCHIARQPMPPWGSRRRP